MINLNVIVYLLGCAKLVNVFQGAPNPSRYPWCQETQPIRSQHLAPRNDLPVTTASLHDARAPRVCAQRAKSSCAHRATPPLYPAAVPRPPSRHPRTTWTRLYPWPAMPRRGRASTCPSARRSAAVVVASGAAQLASLPAAAEKAAGDPVSYAAVSSAALSTNCPSTGSPKNASAAAIALSGSRSALCGYVLAAVILSARHPVAMIASRDWAGRTGQEYDISMQMNHRAARSGDTAAAWATAAGLRRAKFDRVGLAAVPEVAARWTQVRLDERGFSDRTVTA